MNETSQQTIFIVDGYGLIFREYYAFIKRPLVNAKGENISALHGFFNNLAITLRMFHPDFLIVALDSLTKTFRHEIFGEYKTNRSPTPNDLRYQFPWIESFLNELGCTGIRVEGFEADDIIATLSKKIATENRKVFILSSDKDLLQLVNENVKILRPGKIDKSKIWEEVDESIILEEWGVPPTYICDVLSLMGDTVDNVPGVRGIGGKTAAKLLDEYGTLDGIYKNVQKIKGALGKKLIKGKENAYFSQKLVSLRFDVPLADFDLQKYAVNDFPFVNFAKKCREFSLFRVANLFEELSENSILVEEELKIQKNQGKYRVILSKNELFDAIKSAIDAKTIAIDTETDSFNTRTAKLVGVSFAWTVGEGVYVPLFCVDYENCLEKSVVFDALLKLFFADVTLVFHNAKFDLEVLFSNGFFDFKENEPDLFSFDTDKNDSFDLFFSQKARLFDTMLAAWVLSPDGEGRTPFSISTLAKTKLFLEGTEFDDIVGKKQTFADVPLKIATDYCAEVSDFALQLHKKLLSELESARLFDVYQKEITLLPILAKMELRGIHVDSSVLADYSLELSQKIDLLSQKIYAEAGHDFNIASPRQLGVVLFEEMNLKGTRKTRAGAYSTDEDSLMAIKENEIVADVLDWRGKTKLLSKIIRGFTQVLFKRERRRAGFQVATRICKIFPCARKKDGGFVARFRRKTAKF